MSYCAVGKGFLSLRIEKEPEVKAALSLRLDSQCRTELAQPYDDSIKGSIRQRYAAKEELLAALELKKSLEDELKELGFSDVSYTCNDIPPAIFIDFCFDAKYHENEILSLLNALEPYTIEGTISFQGEDDELWRLIFKDGHWKEERGEIVYTDAAAAAANPPMPYPPFAEKPENLELLMKEINRRMLPVDEPPDKMCRRLLNAFRQSSPDGVLLALTGWSLHSLGVFAGLWPDTEGVSPQ